MIRRRIIAQVAGLVLATCFAVRGAPSPAGFVWTETAVTVTNLPPAELVRLRVLSDAAAWCECFAVKVVLEGISPADLPPVEGAYAVTKTGAEFRPRHSLRAGVRYHARFQFGSTAVTGEHFAPAPVRAPRTVVRAVYPSADVLPENLLKFYLHFSHPMRRGNAYEHIRLLDERGRPVDLPFLELDEELWDPELKRLTLLIDPGRIKREVKPLEDIGPALEAHHRYTLHIRADWRDGDGAPLRAEFRKAFLVGSPDRRPVDPVKWRIVPPSAGTREPLGIHFHEALDHGLASRVIHVTDAQGRPLEGTIALGEKESVWRFTPALPWRAGEHRIVAEHILEDLAGNSIGRPFEVDVFERVERNLTRPSARIPFSVK